MKYVFLLFLLIAIGFLVSCVTPIVDYETCETINCASPVDIEVSNATE